jgi:hypothetical protein
VKKKDSLVNSEDRNENPGTPERQPHRIRIPGFLIEEEIGLGDLIKKTTYAMGVKPCSGCEKRAASLNRWMRLTR